MGKLEKKRYSTLHFMLKCMCSIKVTEGKTNKTKCIYEESGHKNTLSWTTMVIYTENSSQNSPPGLYNLTVWDPTRSNKPIKKSTFCTLLWLQLDLGTVISCKGLDWLIQFKTNTVVDAYQTVRYQKYKTSIPYPTLKHSSQMACLHRPCSYQKWPYPPFQFSQQAW